MAYLVGKCAKCGTLYSDYKGRPWELKTMAEMREQDPDYVGDETDTREYILHPCCICQETSEFIVIPSLSDL